MTQLDMFPDSSRMVTLRGLCRDCRMVFIRLDLAGATEAGIPDDQCEECFWTAKAAVKA